MNKVLLIFLTLCIAVKIHLSESFPQCCPTMCCPCGCGSAQRSAQVPRSYYPSSDDPDDDGQADDDDGLVRKSKKPNRHKWDKADTIISGVQAVADVGNLVKDVAQIAISGGDEHKS